MTAVPIEAGLCSVTFRSLRPAEVVDLADAADLRHIEWGADVHVPPGDDAGAEQVARRCAHLGITVSSYGTYLTAGKLEGSDERHGTVEANLDTAAVLGAPNVRVWAVGDGAPDELASICERAAERDLAVSVEYHPDTCTETSQGALELLDAVDAPNLFTYWQPDPDLAPRQQLRDLVAVRHRLSHLHVFAWTAHRTRLALDADVGAELWPDALAAAAGAELPAPPGGVRVAFLEFVRDDDPARLQRDAATLLGWLEQQP